MEILFIIIFIAVLGFVLYKLKTFFGKIREALVSSNKRIKTWFKGE